LNQRETIYLTISQKIQLCQGKQVGWQQPLKEEKEVRKVFPQMPQIRQRQQIWLKGAIKGLLEFQIDPDNASIKSRQCWKNAIYEKIRVNSPEALERELEAQGFRDGYNLAKLEIRLFEDDFSEKLIEARSITNSEHDLILEELAGWDED